MADSSFPIVQKMESIHDPGNWPYIKLVDLGDGTYGFGVREFSGSNGIPVAVTVTASPFTWVNDLGGPAIAYVTGGTVSLAQTIIGALTTTLTGGAYLVPAGASLKLTYLVAPTLNVVRL